MNAHQVTDLVRSQSIQPGERFPPPSLVRLQRASARLRRSLGEVGRAVERFAAQHVPAWSKNRANFGRENPQVRLKADTTYDKRPTVCVLSSEVPRSLSDGFNRMKKGIPVAAGLAAALLISYYALSVNQRSPLTDTFNRIYTEGSWGKDVTGRGTSGSGSTLDITREYRAYVEDFIRKNNVRSVVDAGCGDWTFSSAIDWGTVNYLGVDIASDVIDAVRKKYEKPNIRFQVGDITEELPAADLLISKDVLQHLPNALVQKFVSNNLKKGKYKWVLLTNDRGSGNPDITPGGYRMIDLAAAPFNVSGLVDLPIRFGNEVTKTTSLLNLGSSL